METVVTDDSWARVKPELDFGVANKFVELVKGKLGVIPEVLQHDNVVKVDTAVSSDQPVELRDTAVLTADKEAGKEATKAEFGNSPEFHLPIPNS